MMRMRARKGRTLLRLLLFGAVCFSAVTAAQAQAQRDRVARPEAEVINRHFFQPRLALANAERISLTPQQRTTIEAAMHESQATFRRVRFELGNAMTVLSGLAVRHPVDEEGIIAQLDRILELEREIKHEHLAMLVRVKNALTPEQHLQLDEFKRRGAQQRNGARQQ